MKHNLNIGDIVVYEYGGPYTIREFFPATEIKAAFVEFEEFNNTKRVWDYLHHVLEQEILPCKEETNLKDWL